MFSLPTIFPRDSHPLYYPSSSTHNHHHHHHHSHQQHQPHSTTNIPSDNTRPNPNNIQTQHPNLPPIPIRTPLTILAADEAIIAYRKRALARYGATWLRPPGVTKTLQGRDDERAEREEAEAQREREARAEEEMMRAQELADAQEGEGEDGDGEEEGEEVDVDLDADVPDADADVGGEWSDDDEEEEEVEGEDEDEEEDDEREVPPSMRAAGVGRTGMGTAAAAMGMGEGLFDGPATPQNDDRTPQRFRLNPFQAPTAEGDGDYGSPLAARHSHRAAAARARDVSPGVMAAAAARRGHGDATAGTRRAVQGGGVRAVTIIGAATATPANATTSINVAIIDMEADLDDAIPMDETMMEGGSYEHTDTELEDLSSEDERSPAGGMAGVGSRSVFGGGGIAAAVRRISGQERRASGAATRRASGERRVNGGVGGGARRASGRGRGHPGREN